MDFLLRPNKEVSYHISKNYSYDIKNKLYQEYTGDLSAVALHIIFRTNNAELYQTYKESIIIDDREVEVLYNDPQIVTKLKENCVRKYNKMVKHREDYASIVEKSVKRLTSLGIIVEQYHIEYPNYLQFKSEWFYQEVINDISISILCHENTKFYKSLCKLGLL